MWDIKTGLSQLELEMPGHAWGLCVAWSPDGSLIAAGSRGGSSRVWTSIAGHVVADLDGHTGAVCTMAWAPSGRRLLTGAEDGQVRRKVEEEMKG